MTRFLRVNAVLTAGILLVACGSKPVPQPAAVTHSQDAMTLGMQAYADDRYIEARGYFERALVEFRSVDNLEGQLDALVDLADSALGQGEYAAAREYLAQADSILAGGQVQTIAAHVALLQAYADLQAGNTTQAVARLDKLLADPDIPDNVTRSALFARTQAAFDAGSSDTDQWLDKLGAAVKGHPDPLVNARYLRLQALAAQHRGDMKQAAANYQSALQEYRNSYYRPGIAATLEESAALSSTMNDWPSAHDRLRRALEIRLWMYDRTHSEKDLEKLSQVDAKLGNDAASKQDLKLADYLRNGGNPAQLPTSE